jgi:hypothetical protein
VNINGETCKVQLLSGITDFRTTVVKPFYKDNNNDKDNNQKQDQEQEQEA